ADARWARSAARRRDSARARARLARGRAACRCLAARRRGLYARRDRPAHGPHAELLEVAACARARASARGVGQRRQDRTTRRNTRMHPRTEDLLTLRDGDPADADKVARWRAVPGTAHAVARLERMRDALRALPELDPPAGSWETIEARLAAPEPSAGRASGRETARGAFAARVAGSAAALVLTAMAVMT